jgi:hypothetical protein
MKGTDYGQIMRTLLEDALSHEEKELENLRVNANGKHVSLKSVQQYEERWIQLLVAKQQARSQVPFHVVTEEKSKKKSIDMTLASPPTKPKTDGPPKAYFELKGPFNTAFGSRVQNCTKDIRELHTEEKGKKGVPRFFVLLLHANDLTEAMQAVNERLLNSPKLQGMAEFLKKAGSLSPIPLNPTGEEDSRRQLFVFMFRVLPRS